ncbi:unnamed protein product [Anisakis simplex]|uniref:BRF1 domain-containing protein n=1 Tax=Anisakis simplex TaxID=6269 RepID=A0A0M3J2F8_ANISI|nr:unnamed protein product [Anisakis simplex]
MKRKRIQQQLKQRRKGEGDEYLSEHQIQGAKHLESEGDEEFVECDGNRTDDIPGRNGTLIVITEDGKTWRRRNMRKKGSEQILEYFNCISCEAVKRYLPTGKVSLFLCEFPTLSFLYTLATNVRVLQTNPATRHHICGNARSTARTTAEQLVRKRKAVARLAGIGSVYAYDSAASEARNLGAAENWDESFLSNVLEEIVTRTPRRSREQHQSSHNSAPSHSREISSIPDSHFDDSGCSRSSVPKPTATQSASNQRASSWVKRETSHIGDDASIQRSVAQSNCGNHPNRIVGSLSDSQYS